MKFIHKKIIPLFLFTAMVLNCFSALPVQAQEEGNAETNTIVENVQDPETGTSPEETTDPVVPDNSLNENPTQEESDQENLDLSVPAENENESVQDHPAVPEDKEAPQVAQEGDASLVNYFYVGSPLLQAPGTQEFVLSLGNGSEGIETVKLYYQKEDGSTEELINTQKNNELFVFTKSFDAAQAGTYSVSGFSYFIGEQEYTVSFSNLQMNPQFGVNEEYEGYGQNEVYAVDENGNEITSKNSVTEESADIEGAVVTLDGDNASDADDLVKDVLKQNTATKSRRSKRSITTYSQSDPLVICIDPGHGGNDSGTVTVNNTYEKTINLKIATYLKQELEQYNNVKVVMTRTGDTNPSLDQRAQIAKNAGATALVSIHINATGWGTQNKISGAEVYYPNENYNANVHETGKNLAQNVLNQLTALGITNRGIKVKYVYNSVTGEPANDPAYDYPDGSVGDYYGVIRSSKRLGVAGIIVEHCFADNWNDYNNYLSSDAKLQKLGIADATGIAKAFNLTKPSEDGIENVLYQTHVQTSGWQDWKQNGDVGGTSGQSKRLEAINIKLSGKYSGSIQYQTHVQTYGWQGWVADGKTSGTSGESKRLEAIRIKLSGDVASKYDVYYRVHAQQFGWLGWAKNGESAGTAGYSYRLEAIQIQLVAKGGKAPGSTEGAFRQRLVSYQSHIQTIGWQGKKYDGEISGTTGRSLRMEAIQISLPSVSGGVQYSSHVQTYGWQNWVSTGQTSGTSGQSKRLEAIKIKLTGEAAKNYDIYYRVHAQQFGWLGWAKNGESAGTAGYSYRLEGIQIQLVPKGGKAPGSTTNSFYDKNAVNTKGYTIMGASNISSQKLVQYYNTYKGSVASYDKYEGLNAKYNGTLAQGGASTIEQFCQIFYEECIAEGVKPEVAFIQSMLETGFLRFTGTVLPNQYNFAGLGATGGGNKGNSFSSVRIGIRAQIQHLKCYASKEPLNQKRVDPRWSESLRGKATTVEQLQGTWAMSTTYAQSMLQGLERIVKL